MRALEQRPSTAPSAADRDPIAIVGIGCRFPGANSPAAFWALLEQGVDAISDMPPGRFDVDAFVDPRPGTPGKMVTRQGGFLAGIDQFDPLFFGISPREAASIDPQHRLLLETTWEAFEDAGITRAQVAGTRTGVFIGMWTNEYENRIFDTLDLDAYDATGGSRFSASGRLSFFFDLRGPSLTIDAACSSSLVAVHSACRSVWTGESTMAIAGGVNVVLDPFVSIGFSRSGMLAPDARCKFGDARADGFVRSEGVGVVVLKPYSRAVADGDPIYAVVLGSAVSNDGSSNELLFTPSVEGQMEMLRAAYRDAGVSPAEIAYVEAHGAGTPVGDVVELEALGRVLVEDRKAKQVCPVGSVKTNFGHTEGAAGIAGLIKVALSLRHAQIPPSLHFREPNPGIPWDDLPLAVARELAPWPVDAPIAGVNSFGLTGTNAHVVVQGLPRVADPGPAPRDGGRANLLPISAHSSAARAALASAYAALLEDEETSATDLCYTASVRRNHHAFRTAIPFTSASELRDRLAALGAGELPSGAFSGRVDKGAAPKIAFVYPGQGSQWVGMGRELLAQEPVFRECMERCDAAVGGEVGWSVLDELVAEESSRLDRIDVIQPVLFSIQVAATALWESWGISPSAVVGHSMGEVAAAYVADALGIEDAARLICRRSELLRRTAGRGAMAVVELSIEQAREALSGREDRLSVAVSNSSRSTVISGNPDALDELLDELERHDIFCRRVNVDVAAHSPQVDELRAELLDAVKDLRPREGRVPVYSTVSGGPIDGAALDAAYWCRNLRQPVMFAAALRRLVDDGHDVFIEVSPHPVLLAAIQQELHELGVNARALPTLRREEERAVMLESLGALYTAGAPIDWLRLHPESARCVSLPPYPWQRERCWRDRDDRQRAGRSAVIREGSLLGSRFRSSVHAGAGFWEGTLSLDNVPFLGDHRVDGVAIMPAAAMIAMALEAGAEAFGGESMVLSDLRFDSALIVPSGGELGVQVALVPGGPAASSFTIASLDAADESPDPAWTFHAGGLLHPAAADADDVVETRVPPEAERGAAVAVDELYSDLDQRRLQYGAAFRGVERLWHRPCDAWGEVRLPSAVPRGSDKHVLHPALLDACFQVLLDAITRSSDVAPRDTYVPVGLRRLRLFRRPDHGGPLLAHACGRVDDTHAEINGDLLLLEPDGTPIAEVRGLRLQRLSRRRGDRLADSLYTVEWQAADPLQSRGEATDVAPTWVVLSDGRGVGRELAQRLAAAGTACIEVSAPGDAPPASSGLEVEPDSAEGFAELLEACRREGTGRLRFVHLWGLDLGTAGEQPSVACASACARIAHLVQALAGTGHPLDAALYLVTAGAQSLATDDDHSPLQSSIWGMGRTIANEYPELRCRRIDLSCPASTTEIDQLVAELLAGDGEDEVALRGDTRSVLRVVPWSSSAPGDAPWRGAQRDEGEAAPSGPFRIESAQPGSLDGLVAVPATRRQPEAGAIEIGVHACGLNFMNVMSALGVYPTSDGSGGTLGLECAGTVERVGEGVTELRPGDEVIALAYDCLASHALADSRLVVHKPAGMSFEEAASIPVVFVTAYMALVRMARLQPGESVLIHAGAGGVGLAAIQLAQHAGADVYATAGSERKRDFLRSVGVKQVMDSRSLRFADEVLEATGGRGVDVVLNSLAGPAIERGLACLAHGGRFVEIGKRDIYDDLRIGLGPFRKGLSYVALDLDWMIRERPEEVAEAFEEVMELHRGGALQPLRRELFPVARAGDAFHHMARAKHIGKLVISVDDREGLLLDASRAAVRFGGGTYLITGGLGALGLAVARWMAEHGAESLVLLGRSGGSPAARAAVDEVRRAGAEVAIMSCDVSNRDGLAAVLEEIEATLPPLTGVIHAAGVLDDAVVANLTAAQFASVLAPKVAGAWNLHDLTSDRSLTTFVLFSSVASLIGTSGQANYAAANAALDALAHRRRARGLPAISINWGPWAEIGLAAAEARRGERLARGGLDSFSPEAGLDAFERILRADPVQVAVMPLDWPLFASSNPAAARAPRFEVLARTGAAGAGEADAVIGNFRDDLLAAAPGKHRRTLMESHLLGQVSRVLRLDEGRLDLRTPLREFGLDSLLGLELRNRLESNLQLSLPGTLVYNYPTVSALAAHLAERMGIPLEPDNGDGQATVEAPAPEEEDEDVARLLDDLEKLSPEELDRLLAEDSRMGANDE